MLWGSGSTSTWNSNAKAAIAAGSDTLLAFNEPDLSTQSNLDPTTAANLFKQYMQPFACQARLSAPAVTNGGAPMGLTWLGNFLQACSGCTVDVVPIHWYDSATNIGYFQSYIQQAYVAGGNRTLWITEFGASGTDAQVTSFFQTVRSSRAVVDEILTGYRFCHGWTHCHISRDTPISWMGQII
jgi:hypothetical protein